MFIYDHRFENIRWKIQQLFGRLPFIKHFNVIA